MRPIGLLMLLPTRTHSARRRFRPGLLACFFAASPVLVSVAWGVEIEPDRRSIRQGRNPATGHVTCGSGSGTAQLVGSQNVIITAAHVLYGRNGLRGAPGTCTFSLMINSERRSFLIDTSRIRAGTEQPYAMPASFDWAVARLSSPVEGTTPYAFGSSPSSGQAVTLVSGRTLGVTRGVITEDCQVRALRNAEGGRETMLDCSAQSGDSGAAVLDRAGRIAAIYVGFRSTAPQSRQIFSSDHYNFAVSVNARMRMAVSEMTR